MIHLNCPQCQKRYRLDDALAGRTVRCRECNTSFPVVAADPNAAADSLVEDLVDAEVVEAEVVEAEVVEAEVIESGSVAGGQAIVNAASESSIMNEPSHRDCEPISGRTPELSYEISQRPDFSLLKVDLQQGAKVLAEPSAMVSMSAGMHLKAGFRGGVGRSLGRMFGGESLVVNTFTAESGPGEIMFAGGSAGDIAYKRLENSCLYLQRGAYMANTDGIDLTGKWQGAKGFFSGEGLVLLKASGTGDLFFNSYGAILPIDVSGDFIVDTGYIVAFEETLQYRVTVLQGSRARGKLKSFFFGGEGLVCQFSGQGRVWVQTRQVSTFLQWANAYRPTSSN